MFKKYRTTIAVLSVALFILYAGGIFGTFAWFLRTWWLGNLTPASSWGQLLYGYGLWDNWRGYWTWYGYVSGEVTNNNDSRYAQGTQTNLSVTLSGWSTNMTGAFTWQGNIQIVIPVGTIITPVNGWIWTWLINIPTSGTYTVIDSSTIQWVVNVDFSFLGGALFSKPVKIVIPVSGIASAKVRADHHDGHGLVFKWLTLYSTWTCSSGIPSDQYDGADILVSDGGTITIYTCAASTFVAYTPYSPPPSWGGWWGWWWGGWWGGWVSTPTTDYCPKGDFSPSRYDGTCGTAKVKTIISSWDITNNLLSGGTTWDITSTTWSITSTTWSTTSTTWDSAYSQEYNDAFQFALSKGITTMPTIKQANMTWVLTRATMAKMIVNYAINVLGKTLNTWAVCTFTDTTGQSTEMQGYIIKACQLWLMGIGKTTFTPKNIVTRAQLWTVLSRLLYATPESGAPYYLVHLNTLKDKWVITNTTPTSTEKRVYLMLMLMRAAK